METKSEWDDGKIIDLSNKNYFSHHFLCLGVLQKVLFGIFSTL